jgi:hypothetical protein
VVSGRARARDAVADAVVVVAAALGFVLGVVVSAFSLLLVLL